MKNNKKLAGAQPGKTDSEVGAGSTGKDLSMKWVFGPAALVCQRGDGWFAYITYEEIDRCRQDPPDTPAVEHVANSKEKP